MSNVIKIGDFELSRRRDTFSKVNGKCLHRHVSCDDVGEIVTCDDCNLQVSAYWALGYFSQVWEREMQKLADAEKLLNEQRSKSLHLIAAQKVEKAWRSHGMVPACPHCERGILASDGLGRTQVNKAIELRRREVERKP